MTEPFPLIKLKKSQAMAAIATIAAAAMPIGLDSALKAAPAPDITPLIALNAVIALVIPLLTVTKAATRVRTFPATLTIKSLFCTSHSEKVFSLSMTLTTVSEIFFLIASPF